MRVEHKGTALLAAVLSAGGWSFAQEEGGPRFEPYIGQATVRTLNVRSGPSTNYYVVARVQEGDRLKVVGKESGWLAVVPPAECFSLIAAEFVDRGNEAEGVVNGSNVRVRAGSDLSSDTYAVQTKLQRGALVRIIEPYDDQFLKIVPPEGATVWVADEYIRAVPEAAPDTPLASAAERAEGESDETTDSEAIATAPVPAPAEVVASSKADLEETERQPPAPVEPAVDSAEACRRRLEALDARLKEEMSKPAARRDFSDLKPGYVELTAQEVDRYTQAYARVRVQQIDAAQELMEGLRKVRRMREEVRVTRRDALTERASIRPKRVPIEGGFDAEGELRVSALYDSPVGPQRYRLVHPGVSPARTIAYVEIPRGSDINISDYLGRRIGVRASERVLQTGDVNPIAIYVAAELVVLDRSESRGEPGERLADTDAASDSPDQSTTALKE